MNIVRPTGHGARHLLVAMLLAAVTVGAVACDGPFGPATAPGPISGHLAPVVTAGVPATSAAVTSRTICTPTGVTITVDITGNEHDASIVLQGTYPGTPAITSTVSVGGGSAVLYSTQECFTVTISHLDLGTTGDDLDYVINW